MADTKVASGGVSLATVLVAIFVTLKLTHVIDWSWWWVFSPWWIGLAVIISIAVIVLLVAIIIKLLS